MSQSARSSFKLQLVQTRFCNYCTILAECMYLICTTESPSGTNVHSEVELKVEFSKDRLWERMKVALNYNDSGKMERDAEW